MTTPPASRLVHALAIAASVVIGAMTAVQSRINGELGQRIGDGYLAAVISFGSGLVILVIAMLAWKRGRTGLRLIAQALRSRSMPWWYLVGGAAGAFLVLSQGLTAAVLGVALFTVAIVSGQTISGLIIDRQGMGTMAPKTVTVSRLAGSLLALAAVVWAVSAQITGDIPLWMLVMPFLAGAGIGWQQAVNGQVRTVADSALTATFNNFVVGTVVLVVAFAVHGAVAGWPTGLPSEPYLYLGGSIGVIFIASAAIVVRIVGVLLLGLGTIAGQLIMSLALDFALPVPGHEIVWTTVAGTLLTLVAVAIAATPSRALRSSSSA
ncbi:transporter family-2 protein [Diaminobutyricimonas aerilata]|uniref:Transporter family-2 protein n=1 Tax=Diaminobutyricimonas aerilata TaxID=1162967 RepID=A0A2M9CMB5_9MICO|nr:DMT family transporter [Diaminobutyricimonas aerilata]PJJ73035.1 transporter family-2 protein [Diaminobutyricimonas aerilata]